MVKKGQKIATKLRTVLTNKGYNVKAFDFVANSETGNITAFVTSSRFNGIDENGRQQKIWRVIKKEMTENEYLKISGVIPLTPKENDELQHALAE